MKNPCLNTPDEDDCLAVSVDIPDPCTPPAGNPDYCKLDVCDFHAGNDCEVSKCLEDEEGRCETDPNCVWIPADPLPTGPVSTLVGFCDEKQCLHTQQADCEKDEVCKWDGANCVETECGVHRNEKDCDQDATCHWDLDSDPTNCKETPCAPYKSQDPCNGDDDCMWTTVHGTDVCVPKTCEKYDNKCECEVDADCKWHHGQGTGQCVATAYDTCPDMDVAFVLDGSGSMSRSFGKHKHGFYGLMEILRDWLKDVPLTGDDHTAGADISSKGKGFRMTFIQFSKRNAKPEEDHPINCAVGECTSGLLSGHRDELQGDIDWHEDNYQSQWTYLHDALGDVAEHTFVVTQSPPWREHVVRKGILLLFFSVCLFSCCSLFW